MRIITNNDHNIDSRIHTHKSVASVVALSNVKYLYIYTLLLYASFDLCCFVYEREKHIVALQSCRHTTTVH